MQGRKCARKGETKRTKRTKQSGDEDASMAIASGSPASCCTSDSESNASLESADADARPKGKARASRGATTEPQSIYARVLLIYYMIILFCLFMKVSLLFITGSDNTVAVLWLCRKGGKGSMRG